MDNRILGMKVIVGLLMILNFAIGVVYGIPF
jgi:hypothetical protein